MLQLGGDDYVYGLLMLLPLRLFFSHCFQQIKLQSVKNLFVILRRDGMDTRHICRRLCKTPESYGIARGDRRLNYNIKLNVMKHLLCPKIVYLTQLKWALFRNIVPCCIASICCVNYECQQQIRFMGLRYMLISWLMFAANGAVVLTAIQRKSTNLTPDDTYKRLADLPIEFHNISLFIIINSIEFLLTVSGLIIIYKGLR